MSHLARWMFSPLSYAAHLVDVESMRLLLRGVVLAAAEQAEDLPLGVLDPVQPPVLQIEVRPATRWL